MGKYKSAGKKSYNLKATDEFFSDTDNQEILQWLEFTNEQLPEIENWETEQEYELKIKVKLVSKIEGSNNEQEGKFEVVMVKSGENDIISDETPEQIRVRKILE